MSVFSIDPKTGDKVDAHIHGPILDGVSKRDDLEHRRKARLRTRKFFTNEELDRAYGKNSRGHS